MADPITIVLADDHPIVREGLAAVLANDPRFRVIGECSDGLEVAGHVASLQPDVLVLDISMPGMNGLDICRQVRRRTPRTAVLFLSMHGDEQMILRGLDQGAAGYVVKGTATSHLAEAIDTVAHGGRYLSPGIPPDILQRRARGERDPYEQLTARERQVLQLIAEGKGLHEIADALGMASKTVNTHRYNLMKKLDVHSQTALVKYAFQRGLVAAEPPVP